MLSFLNEEEARDHNISLCQIIAVYVVSSNRCRIVSSVQYRHNFHAHCTKHADTQKLETAEIVMPMHNTLGINAQLLSALHTPLPENINLTSRPCRTLFGYCPPPALGSRKADMNTLSFFFPTPYPCHVRASSYQAQTSWAAELPVPVPYTHFFYALSMIMAGYVGVPCSY